MRLRRAIVVLMSAQGQPGPGLGHLLKVPEDDVWDVIHAFNDGFRVGQKLALALRCPKWPEQALNVACEY
ncbi:hypothetical protein O7626_14420 [Micromonospora sp. WMMD1102]|uniref:hypothetical protein n=1 Tax=Micromonospora sp. WMMD1102 TaxID=3016105 RepID=UPI002415094A|nr:hypothetical protein [Micromonospora sp. WMMD1102]MDG4787109.1 hypothetical protein [Micromonospora sp. WMMD1102]